MKKSPRLPIVDFRQSQVLRAGLGLLLTCAAMSKADPVLAAPAQESRTSVQSQILTLEKDFNDAYAHNDLPRYFSFYAQDFRGLFPDGVYSKAAYVKEWTAYINGGSKMVDFTWSDMVITASPTGDAAVASYHAVATTKEPHKAQAAEKYDETDVWFRRSGKFELVVVQYSHTGNPP